MRPRFSEGLVGVLEVVAAMAWSAHHLSCRIIRRLRAQQDNGAGRGRGVALNAADALERSKSWRSCLSTRRRGDDRGQPESTRAMNEVACEVVQARPMISGVVGPRTNYWGALAQEQWSCLPHALSMRLPTLHQICQGASGRGTDHTAARPLRGTVRATRSSKAPRSRRTDLERQKSLVGRSGEQWTDTLT